MNLNTSLQYYTWNNYRLAYDAYNIDSDKNLRLLLIHPTGVGLFRYFWNPFIEACLTKNPNLSIYNPDFLGCGQSDLPRFAYYPEDWATQLQYFLENIIKKPVVVIVQGISTPVAFELVKKCSESNLIKGLVIAGPSSWELITQKSKPFQQKLLWNLLFDSIIGNLFYRYARQKNFLRSFSKKQLFANGEAVDDRWLNILEKGSADTKARYAVFSVLAGFWITDYFEYISNISQPTLVVFGDKASSINKTGATETPQQRLDLYLKYLPNGSGKIIKGRNVLPYESTNDFVNVVLNFIDSKII